MMSTSREPKKSIRRRTHRKSRGGCLVCKARRVKCDQQFPSCANCIKRGAQCGYSPRQVPGKDLQVEIEKRPSLDLELLHHFCVSTAYTLCTETAVQDLWRVFVPQLGLGGADYILDGVMALAALHKAREDPERREELLFYALHYHSESLAKGWPLVSTITPQNGSSLYVFAVLAIHFSLGWPRDADEMLLGADDAMTEILRLLEGAHLVRESQHGIEASPASLIFQTTESSFDFWCTHNPDYHPALVELNHRIGVYNAHDDSRRETLQTAVRKLGRSYTFMDNPLFKDNDRFRGYYSWLYNVREGYWELLQEGSDEALCVLAFFFVLVREMENSWWLEGWSDRLIREIYGLLKEEFRPWIAFPMERIGWIPSPAQRDLETIV